MIEWSIYCRYTMPPQNIQKILTNINWYEMNELTNNFISEFSKVKITNVVKKKQLYLNHFKNFIL